MDATFPSHSPPEAEAAPQPHFSTQEASALESLLFLKGIEVVLIPTDLPEVRFRPFFRGNLGTASQSVFTCRSIQSGRHGADGK
jgi:hypothetical protein